MNGVDYTKQINKEREYMRDALQKNRVATDKELADQQNRHEAIQEKKSQNMIEDKAELEKHYGKNQEELREKTKEAIENKNKQYNEALSKARDNFENIQASKSRSFDQRLHDIKNSYQKQAQDSEDAQKNILEAKSKLYNRNINDMSQKTDKKIAEYHDKVSGEGASLKHKMKEERAAASRAQEDQLRNIYKQENKEKMDIKDRLQDNLAKTKEVHEGEKNHLEKHTKQQIKHARDNSESRVQHMAREFSERQDKMVEAGKIENKKNNKLQAQKFLDNQRDFNKQVREMELETKLRTQGSGDFSEASKAQSGFDENSINANRVKQLRGELNKTRHEYSERWAKDQDVFKDELRTESAEAAGRMARREKELRGENLVTMTNERSRAQKLIDTREEQNLIAKKTNEKLLHDEQSNGRTRLNRMKETFNNTAKDLESKHNANLESVRFANKADKANYVKNMTEERNSMLFDMKREQGKAMDRSVAEYEMRLATKQKEYENMRTALEDKLATTIDESDKKLENALKTYEERRLSDLRDHQLLTEQKENQLKGTINMLNLTHQKKMDQMGQLSDRKIKLLTQDYENKLKNVQESKVAELNSKDVAQAAELERMKTSFEDQKMRLMNQYESRITTIRNAHEEQMQQMRDFKKLV